MIITQQQQPQFGGFVTKAGAMIQDARNMGGNQFQIHNTHQISTIGPQKVHGNMLVQQGPGLQNSNLGGDMGYPNLGITQVPQQQQQQHEISTVVTGNANMGGVNGVIQGGNVVVRSNNPEIGGSGVVQYNTGPPHHQIVQVQQQRFSSFPQGGVRMQQVIRGPPSIQQQQQNISNGGNGTNLFNRVSVNMGGRVVQQQQIEQNPKVVSVSSQNQDRTHPPLQYQQQVSLSNKPPNLDHQKSEGPVVKIQKQSVNEARAPSANNNPNVMENSHAPHRDASETFTRKSENEQNIIKTVQTEPERNILISNPPKTVEVNYNGVLYEYYLGGRKEQPNQSSQPRIVHPPHQVIRNTSIGAVRVINTHPSTAVSGSQQKIISTDSHFDNGGTKVVYHHPPSSNVIRAQSSGNSRLVVRRPPSNSSSNTGPPPLQSTKSLTKDDFDISFSNGALSHEVTMNSNTFSSEPQLHNGQSFSNNGTVQVTTLAPGDTWSGMSDVAMTILNNSQSIGSIGGMQPGSSSQVMPVQHQHIGGSPPSVIRNGQQFPGNDGTISYTTTSYGVPQGQSQHRPQQVHYQSGPQVQQFP